MKIKNLKRLISIILSLVLVLLLASCSSPAKSEIVSEDLSETQGAEELAAEEVSVLIESMPEIVFVSYSIDELYDNNDKVIVSGYFVDKIGNISGYYFITDKAKDDRYINDKFIDMGEYVSLRGLNEYHKMLPDNVIGSDLEPIPKADLMSYYETLLKFNKTQQLKRTTNSTEESLGLSGIYGAIIDDNEGKLLVIIEWGDVAYKNEDPYAIELYNQLKGVLPR